MLWAKWPKSYSQASFALWGIYRLVGCCETTMGRLAWGAWEGSQRHSAHTLMLMWISGRFTQSTPRPHRWCEHMRVKACRAAVPQTFVALTQHHRRQSEGPYCYPHPALSAHHTLHMWKDLPPNHHHIGQNTQVSQPSHWPYRSKQNVADGLFPSSFTRGSKH